MTQLLKYSPWSYVHLQEPERKIEVPLKDGRNISLVDLVKEEMPDVKEGNWYYTSPTLGNGDLQTAYAAVGNFEKVDKIYYGRRMIKWDDEEGATVAVDYALDAPEDMDEWKEALDYCPIENPPPFPVRTRYLTPAEILKRDDPREEKPMIISLHGLSGGSHESYLRAVVSKLIGSDSPFENCVLISRGCARTRITTPQLFCGVFTDDIRRLVKHIRRTQPNRRIYLVGYSLGASIMVNYLGQEGNDVQVSGAVSVANAWNLEVCAVKLNETYIGREVYSKTMAKNLLRVMKNQREMLIKNPIFREAENLPPPQYLSEFDDMYTGPFFGFDTAADYYRHGSSVNRLMEVRCPLLILNSEDDPISSKACIPFRESARNPYSVLVTTDVGGHLGWFQPGGKRWFPEVVAKFFKTIESKVDHQKEIVAHLNRPKRLFSEDRLHLDRLYASK